MYHPIDCIHFNYNYLCVFFSVQLSPKASLTVSPSVRARNATVTARSPSATQRSATARSPRTVGTKTKTRTETETKTEEATMLSKCATDATVKTLIMWRQVTSEGIAGTRAAAVWSPSL